MSNWTKTPHLNPTELAALCHALESDDIMASILIPCSSKPIREISWLDDHWETCDAEEREGDYGARYIYYEGLSFTDALDAALNATEPVRIFSYKQEMNNILSGIIKHLESKK